jgi:hypothetical protein
LPLWQHISDDGLRSREEHLDLESDHESEKLKVLWQGKADAMDVEEIARNYSMRELKPFAKKYGIPTRCVKKIDIVKAFPPEALAELQGKHA